MTFEPVSIELILTGTNYEKMDCLLGQPLSSSMWCWLCAVIRNTAEDKTSQRRHGRSEALHWTLVPRRFHQYCSFIQSIQLADLLVCHPFVCNINQRRVCSGQKMLPLDQIIQTSDKQGFPKGQQQLSHKSLKQQKRTYYWIDFDIITIKLLTFICMKICNSHS